MPHDKNNRELKIGDIVCVPCIIESVVPDVIGVKVVDKDNIEGFPLYLILHSKLCSLEVNEADSDKPKYKLSELVEKITPENCHKEIKT